MGIDSYVANGVAKGLQLNCVPYNLIKRTLTDNLQRIKLLG